jgi:hypothetical protein
MIVKIFRVDLTETNTQLKRIADALESLLKLPTEEKPKRHPYPLTTKDIHVYGGGEDETPQTVANRLRNAGATDADIEKLLMSVYDAAEDDVAG